MNKYLLVILCLLSWYDCNAVQQSANESTLTGYMCASASTGTITGKLISAAMTDAIKDGGKFEKLENGESVLKLSRSDFVQFSFTLPETASNVKATIKYHADKETPCFIRWNNVNPSGNEAENKNPKKKENLYYKIYNLKNPQRKNTLRVTCEGNDGLKFYNITITYDYSKPSDNKDNFNVTLVSPDPAKSIEDKDRIVFKWTGIGDCPKEGGWVTLLFCNNNDDIWKTVPGAEFIHLNEERWKKTPGGVYEGKYEWENHGLTEMPDFRIVFTKGPSPIKKAKALYDEALKLKDRNFKEAYKKFKMAQDNIKQAALERFPQNEEYSKYNSLRIKIARELNPFASECRKNGDKISIVINNKEFRFVFIKMGGENFWILNQEVSQAQWTAIEKENPSEKTGNNQPVENVSWDKCKNFCRSFKKKLTGVFDNIGQSTDVTLPTSEQWEHAAQQGGKTLSDKDIHCDTFYLGSPDTIGVTDKPCNGLGIYGMQGNVAEWCLDGKKTSDGKDIKFVRGGSCKDSVDKCQINSLQEKEHNKADGHTGFRFVVIPK